MRSANSITFGQHLLRRGFELKQQGDHDSALRFFSRALDKEPSLTDVRARGVARVMLAMAVMALNPHRGP